MKLAIICLVGAASFGQHAIAGGRRDCDRYVTYVVYEAPQLQPRNTYLTTTESCYSRTVEYRCVTEYYETTECNLARPQHVRYTYVDP